MEALCGGLREIGWDVPDSQGTMFVWAPLPKGYEDSNAFCPFICKKRFSDSLSVDNIRICIIMDNDDLIFPGSRRIYNLSVGTPDFEPAPHVMAAVAEAAQNPENYRYALTSRQIIRFGEGI